ncbi:hypothetical protein SLS59_007336 [Nothophoma quercina]|uniref:DUF6594 domain-containing protein n=1 Tax=Nothophoma quercina TaxID=749835 RepID=A0ABR3QZQ9_9PLEO
MLRFKARDYHQFIKSANTGNTPRPFDPFHDLAPGYPKLAGRMGVTPEIAMFRRFGALNACNLLYMQNDLIDIENDLKELEAEDAKSMEGEKRFYRQNSIWLSTADFEVDDEPRDVSAFSQYAIYFARCAENLDNALIQQATILREMKKPDAFDVEDIQNFIAGDQMRIPFIGPDRKIWGSALNEETRKAYSRELVVLRARKDMDTFSRVLGAKAIDWIMKCGGKRWKKVDVRFGTRAIHDETVYKLTFWLTSAIASILPVVSIILLVKTESLNGRLGIIAAFNVLISICLTFFTEARRTDVFAVTAAYDSLRYKWCLWVKSSKRIPKK